jgi:hypothetical protein
MASGAETTLPSPQTEHPWPFAAATNAATTSDLKIMLYKPGVTVYEV